MEEHTIKAMPTLAMHVTCTTSANSCTLSGTGALRAVCPLIAGRSALAPVSEALKVIVLLGVLRGLHDALLG